MTSPVLLYQYKNELKFGKSQVNTAKQDPIQGKEPHVSDQVKKLLEDLEINFDEWKSVGSRLKHIENLPFIQEYINNTIEKSVYFRDLKVLETFEINRPEDLTNFRSGLKNRRFLWHGTPKRNIGPIIQNGFKLECAANGFFGRGIYFADVCTKALNYCRYILAPFSLFDFCKTNTYYLFLCEVALGKMKRADHLWDENVDKNSMENGENSICGNGEWSTEEGVYNKEGVMICPGKLQQLNSSATLKYDEFIVYDSNQIRLRYLVKVKSVHTNFQLFKRQMRSWLIVSFLSSFVTTLAMGGSSLLCYLFGIPFLFPKIYCSVGFLSALSLFVSKEVKYKIMEGKKTKQMH